MTRRLRLATGVLGRALVKRCLAHLAAEIVDFALVLRLVFRRLLIHFHSTNRIFRQISTSFTVLTLDSCSCLLREVCKHISAPARHQDCLSTCLAYCFDINSGVKPVSSLILGRTSRQSSPVALSLRSKSLFDRFLTVKASLIRFL